MQLTPAVPVAACLALAAFTGYQNAVVIPQLRSSPGGSAAAQAVTSVVLVPSTRGEAPSISVPSAARFFQITLETVAGGVFERYECDLRSGSARTIEKVSVPAPDGSNPINIIVPAGKFAAGSYEAVLVGISGARRQELEIYRFAVRSGQSGARQVQAIP